VALAVAEGECAAALAGQVLLYPCVDTDFTRPSYVNGHDAPFLDSEQMEWFWAQYAPSPADRRNPFAAPMRASDAQLRRVAPAFVATAEHDPLYDEGAAFAARLNALNVEVHYEPGVGLVHGFVRLRDAAPAPAHVFAAMCGWIRQRAAA
jgi:acetyl esterase